MPRIFRIGGYVIFFWVNEGDPLEPVHVHVAEGKPTQSSTKIWITRSGECLLCNNDSRIPERKLRYVMEIVAARSDEIVALWAKTFGSVDYYC